MKRVFSSNREVCHIWAQQTHPEGRASSIFFEGTDIYSYGYHFLAARIHTVKGKRLALITTRRYSATTRKHISHIGSAVHGLMPVFYTSEVCSLKQALADMDQAAQNQVSLALSKSTVVDKGDIRYQFERIHEAFKEANELRKLLGKAEKWPTKKQLDAVQKHLEFRLKRYHELNTPEMVAKRSAEKAKRDARANARKLETQAERIAKFRQGENVGGLDLPYEIIRIKDSEVQTSRGARVPIDEALTLYRALSKGKDISGVQIGHYHVTAVRELDSDRVIQIGCHKILLSEAQAVLGSKLTLVKGGAA